MGAIEELLVRWPVRRLHRTRLTSAPVARLVQTYKMERAEVCHGDRWVGIDVLPKYYRERASLEFDIRRLDAIGITEMMGAGDRRKKQTGGL